MITEEEKVKKTVVDKPVLLRAYQPWMLMQMIHLFFETVHHTCIKHYNRDQLLRWAPVHANIAAWKQRLGNNQCFVAFEGNTIVGFAELADHCHIDTVYVHKNHHQRGIATLLLKKLLGISIANGYRYATTEASITAKPFFLKNGFEVTRQKTNLHNGKPFINYEMTKELI